MDCNHCKTNVEEGLGRINGIDLVQADISTSTVKIKTGNFNPSLIKETVESLGYNYQGEINKPQFQFTLMESYKIFVKGMTCNHCKANVEKALNNIPAISKVEVDLDQSIAKIEGDNIDLNEVKKQLNEVGYEYGGIVS